MRGQRVILSHPCSAVCQTLCAINRAEIVRRTTLEAKVATEFSQEIAAQAWCTKSTSGIVMDLVLAEAFADILDTYIGALQWCGGSGDFQVGGKARRGWNRGIVPLIRAPKDKRGRD